MKPDPSKHHQHQRQEQSLELDQANTLKKEREFATAEELIQFDAAQTAVPGEVAQRLHASIQAEPKSPRSWWRRLFH